MGNTQKFSVRIPVSALALFGLAAYLARAVLEHCFIQAGWQASNAKLLSYLIVPLLLVACISPYFDKCRGFVSRLLNPADLSLKLLISSFLIGILMKAGYWSAIVALVSFGILQNESTDAVVGPVFDLILPPLSLILLSVAVMAFVVPLTEEILYRGFILHALIGGARAYPLVISAGLFAVMHSPGSYLVSFLAGLLLGAQTLKHQTLWAPLITHSTYNAAVVFEQHFIYFAWNPVYPEQHLTIGVASVLILVLSLAGVFYFFCQKVVGTGQWPRRTWAMAIRMRWRPFR